MAESNFKTGDIVCLKSAPHIPLTVSLVHTGQDSFWLNCVYWDEETKQFKEMGIKPAIREELFDFYQPPYYEEGPAPIGYK